jgi:hypothetical protein
MKGCLFLYTSLKDVYKKRLELCEKTWLLTKPKNIEVIITISDKNLPIGEYKFNEHENILTVGGPDSYAHLNIRNIGVIKFCKDKNIEYMMKVDDDCYVDFGRLIKRIELFDRCGFLQKGIWYGNKIYSGYSEGYQEDGNINYFGGSFYFLNNHSIGLLNDYINDNNILDYLIKNNYFKTNKECPKKYKCEDVFIGFLCKECNIQPLLMVFDKHSRDRFCFNYNNIVDEKYYVCMYNYFNKEKKIQYEYRIVDNWEDKIEGCNAIIRKMNNSDVDIIVKK